MDREAWKILCRRRAARAETLADRYPEAAEALQFYAALASFQEEVAPDALLDARRRLVELVLRCGPELLKREAEHLDKQALQRALDSYGAVEELLSPRSFFARALLQPFLAQRRADEPVPPHGCPLCGHRAQVGCLRPRGDGTAMSLACSMCFAEWPHPRAVCPGCREADESKVAFYAAAEVGSVKLQVCETCHRYLHVVDLAKDPEAVPDVDEIAAVALDMWARQNGFRKLTPNLTGI